MDDEPIEVPDLVGDQPDLWFVETDNYDSVTTISQCAGNHMQVDSYDFLVSKPPAEAFVKRSCIKIAFSRR